MATTRPVRVSQRAWVSLLALTVAACGGGGGSSSPTPSPSPTPAPTPSPSPSPAPSPTPSPAPSPVAMSCGGVTSTGTGNTTPLVVDGFPCSAGGTAGAANARNVPYISIQICAPGSTTNCQFIDHVILDTGSTGLRVAASALNSSLQPNNGLPLVTGSQSAGTLTECESYVSSYAYGPIALADVYIAGKKAASVPLQVFGASGYPVPSACSSQGGTETDTTASFEGNGLIGVNFALVDNYALYFDCQGNSANACVADNVYAGTPNVVSQFSGDNNGVTVTLPAISGGTSTAAISGTLAFGVSTQSDNTPPSTATAVTVDGSTDPNDEDAGTFAAAVAGTWGPAYIDSGTDGVYFDDPSDSALQACPTSGYYAGYYCPSTPQAITFSMADTGTRTALGTIDYTVGNIESLYAGEIVAANGVGGSAGGSSTTSSTTIGFGLPVFYGHTLYFLFNGQTAPGTGLGGSSTSTVTGPINAID